MVLLLLMLMVLLLQMLMELPMAACHSLLMVLRLRIRNRYSTRYPLFRLRIRIRYSTHQWACTNCPSSILRRTIPAPLVHHTQGRTILQSSSRKLLDTYQGSPNSPLYQRNSFHTSNPRGSSLNRMRSGCRYMSHAKWLHERRRLDQTEHQTGHQTEHQNHNQLPSLIHSGQVDILPRFCPGTSCPSNIRWSQIPYHTSPRFHSCNPVHTLRSNHRRSPLVYSSCRTSNPKNHSQRRKRSHYGCIPGRGFHSKRIQIRNPPPYPPYPHPPY